MWRWAIQLAVIVASCGASESEFEGDCYPTRLCGFTVKQYVDERCLTMISQMRVAPGSCTGEVVLSVEPGDHRPKGYSSPLGDSASVGDLFSIGGVNDTKVQAIGLWKSSDRGVRYPMDDPRYEMPESTQMLCGAFAPELYISNYDSASSRGKVVSTDNEQCSGEPYLRVMADTSEGGEQGSGAGLIPFTKREHGDDNAYSPATYECFPMEAPNNAGKVYVRIECGDTRCFPASASVTRADGSPARIADLRPGDEIVSATADGRLSMDTVSIFSMAQSNVSAAFLVLETDGPLGAKRLTLTPDHRLPAGPVCCSDIVIARSVKQGQTIWVAAPDGSLAPQAVSEVSLTIATGLYNPLMTNGGFPVVDGVVTAFNTLEVVQFDGLVVPLAERLCSATGTCATLRRAVSGLECAWAQTRHFLREASFTSTACKTSHFIDGTVCHGWSCYANGAHSSVPSPTPRSADVCAMRSA